MKSLEFFVAATATALFVLSSSSPQVKQNSMIKLTPAPVQAKLRVVKEGGRYVVPRTDEIYVEGGPWGEHQNDAHIRLWRLGKKITNSDGVSAPGLQEVNTNGIYSPSTMVEGQEMISFKLPTSFPNGDYLLQIDVKNVGSSARIPIRLVDPKMRILGFTRPTWVGDSVGFKVNFAPPGTKILVKKTKSIPAPEAWWMDSQPTGQTEQLINAEIKTSLGYFVTGKLSKGLGAGTFSAQLKPPTGQLMEAKTFQFEYEQLAFPEYTIRYEGIDCIVDTDELGDDEIYPIFCLGAKSMKWNGNAGIMQWQSYGGSTSYRAIPGPDATNLDKGESRSFNFDLGTVGTYRPIEGLGLGVALFEADGNDKKLYDAQVNIYLQQAMATDPKYASNLLDSYIKNVMNKFDHETDEYLGTKDVPLDDVLKRARQHKGWQKTSVIVSGDGGRFRVRFLVKADPHIGTYEGK